MPRLIRFPRVLLRALLPLAFLFAVEASAQVVEASAIPTDIKEQKAYFRRIYDEGNALFHGKHDTAGGLACYERLEREARAAGNLPWLSSGLWKIAQVRSATGRTEEAVELYEEAREIIHAENGGPFDANRFLVVGNLCGLYRGLGRMGAFAIRHAEGVELARRYFEEKLSAPSLSDPFAQADEIMDKLTNAGFIGQVFFEEARLRFESGREREGIAVAERLERRLGAFPYRNHWERDLHAESRQHLAAWCDEIGLADARDRWEALLLVAEGAPGHGSVSWHLGRIRQAARRHEQGEDRPARRAEIEASLERLRAINQPDDAFDNLPYLAHALSREGKLPEALALLDRALEEIASLQFPSVRAHLLLARADLKLSAGMGGDAQTGSDLREALGWLRDAGRMRDEPEAYLLYALHLGAAGDAAGARAMLIEAQLRTARFIQPGIAERLGKELRLLADADRSTPRSPSGESGDLQPVEIITRASAGDAIGARFFLTNPGPQPIEGVLRVHGPVGETRWDERAMVWRVALSGNTPAREVFQPVRLESLDQARIVLRREPGSAGPEPVEVNWIHSDGRQTAWWRPAEETSARPTTLRGDNLALGNPFYAVPLHHLLSDAARAGGGLLNLRVFVNPPCRVELADDGAGDVLAVDAQGDGDFRRAGDVLWQDRDGDGFPDLNPAASGPDGIELYIYPARGDIDHQVRLESRDAEGVWRTQTIDVVLGGTAR